MTISGVFVVLLVMAMVAAVRAAMLNMVTTPGNADPALLKKLFVDTDDDDPEDTDDEAFKEYIHEWNYEDSYHYNYNYDEDYLNTLKMENNSFNDGGAENTSSVIESLQALNASENENMTLTETMVKFSLMKRFGHPNTTVYDVNYFDVYEIIRNAQELGYTFNTNEQAVLEKELMKTECVDINDNEIPDCRNMTMTSDDLPYKKVRFLLWTKYNSDDFGYDLINERSLGFLNTSHHTYIIFHGFWNYGEVYWILMAKQAILAREPDANVIAVDWYSLAGFPSPYGPAVDNLYKVAEITAELIVYLSKTIDLQTSMISMTGHSLGAHCAGMTAKSIKQRSASLKPIARITGLDPAGPSFFNKPSTLKLDKTDADFVDVIHTNGGNGVGVIRAFLTSTYGYLPPLGHVDFYPNGGKMQPGCWRLYLWCSHSHAYMYWLESINSKPPQVFEAWPCDSWNNFGKGKCYKCNGKCPVMGFDLENTKFCADYYLQTNKNPPFARGDNQPKRTTKLFENIAKIAAATGVGTTGHNHFIGVNKKYLRACN